MVIGDLPLCNLTKGAQQIYLLLGFSPCVVSKICLVICHFRKKKLSSDLRAPSSDPRNNWGRITVPGTRLSKVPIINGPGKLSPFTLKIEVSVVLHPTR